jgi:hypothetical protein
MDEVSKKLLIGCNVLSGIFTIFTFVVVSLFADSRFVHIILGLILFVSVQFGLGIATAYNDKLVTNIYETATKLYLKLTNS